LPNSSFGGQGRLFPALFFQEHLIQVVNKMKRNTQSGFSWIEVLIMLTVIGIIASIAIPRHLASLRAANEASAQHSLRLLNSAEITYRTTIGKGLYGTVATLANWNLVDSGLSSGTKDGYNFTTGDAPAASTSSFLMAAAPVVVKGSSATGTKEFCIDQTGVLTRRIATSQTVATSCAGFSPVGN
jgi:prepilin-type N-terminal cleavage/methylation domain-containing protein